MDAVSSRNTAMPQVASENPTENPTRPLSGDPKNGTMTVDEIQALLGPDAGVVSRNENRQIVITKQSGELTDTRTFSLDATISADGTISSPEGTETYTRKQTIDGATQLETFSGDINLKTGFKEGTSKSSTWMFEDPNQTGTVEPGAEGTMFVAMSSQEGTTETNENGQSVFTGTEVSSALTDDGSDVATEAFVGTKIDGVISEGITSHYLGEPAVLTSREYHGVDESPTRNKMKDIAPHRSR